MPARPKKQTARKVNLSRPQDLDALYLSEGGAEVDCVSISDPDTAEKVKVLLLAEEGYPMLFRLIDGPSYAFADFVCGKPDGWSRQWHPLSVQLIKAKGLELNFTSARQWSENLLSVGEGMEDLMGRNAILQRVASATANGGTASPSSSGSSSEGPPAK